MKSKFLRTLLMSLLLSLFSIIIVSYCYPALLSFGSGPCGSVVGWPIAYAEANYQLKFPTGYINSTPYTDHYDPSLERFVKAPFLFLNEDLFEIRIKNFSLFLFIFNTGIWFVAILLLIHFKKWLFEKKHRKY